MKQTTLILLTLLLLLTNACLPIPPTTPPVTPTLTLTPPAFPTETGTSTASASPTESSTPTESVTPSATSTLSATPTPSATSTDTMTSTATETSTPAPEPITIPALEDWDAGTLAFTHGAEGEWDYILWGGKSNSLIKKDGVYYLYYQGSQFYDTQCESVAHRAIGVATSTDGVTWTKYSGNPVIRWSSQGSVEEGATSSAAMLGPDGRVYMYYGANTGTGCNINTSARLAVSEDGFHFQDLGEVLSGRDPKVWGFGDEIFPAGVFLYQDRWTLFYTPSGVPLARKLGVALGVAPDSFTQTLGLNDGTITVWGPVSIVPGGARSVLAVNPSDELLGAIDFYWFDAADPSRVELHNSYSIPDCNQSSVLYESSTRRWMMSCRDQNRENYYILNAFTP